MAREGGGGGGLAAALLTLSLVALFVAWPPPGADVPPLLGVGSVFVAAPLSVVPLLLALAAGALVGRRFARRHDSFLRRLVISVVVPVGVVGLEAAYLVSFVGFGPRTTIVLGPLVLAAVVGALLEVPN